MNLLKYLHTAKRNLLITIKNPRSVYVNYEIFVF